MSQVSRRRADQLGNLVRMLELGAIDLDAGPRVAKQRLRHRLHHPRFAGAGRPQEQQIAHGTVRRIQASQKHLIDFRYLFDRLILAHNLPAQGSLKVTGVVAAAARIKHGCEVRSHLFGPLFPFRKLHVFWETAHFCHSPAAGEDGCTSSHAPSMCKPLAILLMRRIPPILIVLDAPSPNHVRPVTLPAVPPRAIVCRLLELSVAPWRATETSRFGIGHRFGDAVSSSKSAASLGASKKGPASKIASQPPVCPCPVNSNPLGLT